MPPTEDVMQRLVALVRRRRQAKETLYAIKLAWRVPPDDNTVILASEDEREQYEAAVIDAEREIFAAAAAIDHYRRTGTFLEGQ